MNKTGTIHRKIIAEILKEAREIFDRSNDVHDYDHSLHVFNICKHIGAEEYAAISTDKYSKRRQ
jgi:HD superfamily phosphodiesterase